MVEEWKDIEEYEGVYMVSNWGNVKSLERVDSLGHLRKERILKPFISGKGYFQVQLCKNGQSKKYSVHRLVAEAFIPNDDPERKNQINHIREFEKTNNCIDNLEWCTAKYNTNYGTGNQRRAEKQINGKRSKTLYQYSLEGQFIKEWESTQEVERQLGYSSSNIRTCCLGKRKTAYSFIWRYKNETTV